MELEREKQEEGLDLREWGAQDRNQSHQSHQTNHQHQKTNQNRFQMKTSQDHHQNFA